MLKMAGPSSSAHQMQNNTASFTVASKYRFVRKIGGGSFGDVYLAVHIRTGEEVAVKLENASAPHVGALKTEYKVYHALKGKEGVPGVRWFGPEHNFNALVFDLLGESLEEKFDYCERKFTLKTVVTLADQMISRIEQLHNHFYIHRDIKVYLVDFGLAKKYRDAKGNHILPRQDKKDLTGTARYASVNAHFGFEQSRRDDLESLGYVLIYFMRGGQLPWQGLKDLPQEFAMFLRYCRGLRFDEAPDYEYLRALFRALKLAGNFNYDFAFDWVGKPERDKLAHQRAVAAAEAKKAAVFVQQQMRISPMKTPSALRGIERKRAYAPDETFAAAAYDSPRRRRHEAAAGCSREEENEQEQGGFLEMLQQLPGASFGGGAKRRRVQEADLFGVIGLEEQEEASVGYHFEEMRVMRPDHQEEREESNGRYHHHRQDDRQRDDGQWERVGSYRHPDNRQRAEEQDFGGRYHSQENRNREELSGRYHHQEDRQSEEERDDFAGGYHHRQEDRRRERSPSPAGGLFDLEVRSQPSHNPLAVFFPEAPSNPLFPDAEEVRRRQESDAADGFFPWL